MYTIRVASTIAMVGIAATLAGCGAPGTHQAISSARPSPTTRPATATPTVATSSRSGAQNEVTAAKARLARTVVQAGDLPNGWTSNGASVGDQNLIDHLNAQFVACVGVRNTDLDRVATRTTSFGGPSESLVGSDATVYPSRQDLVDDAAMWRNAKTPGCFRKIGTQGTTTDDHATVRP